MTAVPLPSNDDPAIAGTLVTSTAARFTTGRLTVAGLAALGAGAIHATAVGVHSEHRQAAWTFAVLAVVQLAWGAGALVRSSRQVAAAGLLVNLSAAVGWVVAKTNGIAVIDGLDQAEPIQWADGLAAALATAAVVGAGMALAPRARAARGPTGVVLAGATALVAAATVAGMVTAGSHEHAGAADHGEAAVTGHGHDTETAAPSAAEHTTAVVAPKPYDPTKPIDLGGVEGVTPQQQARAENLIAITLARLPKYADPAVAEVDGFQSIGDGITGHEHYVNWAYVADDQMLNPDVPESLVYEVDHVTGTKTLVSVMYMAVPGTTLETVPDIGGPLTQWHIHDNLCFRDGRVAALTDVDGNCAPGLTKGEQLPMIHVWITPHPCGPFAALEGVAAGQVKPGETRLCDHAHGS